MSAPKDEFCPLHETHHEQLKDHETRLRSVEQRQERNTVKMGIVASIITAVITGVLVALAVAATVGHVG